MASPSADADTDAGAGAGVYADANMNLNPNLAWWGLCAWSGSRSLSSVECRMSPAVCCLLFAVLVGFGFNLSLNLKSRGLYAG